MPFLLIRVVLARYGTSGATPAILLSHSFRTSLLVIISAITVAPVPCLLTRVIPRHFLRGRVEPFAAAFVFAILFFVLASAIDGCIIMFRRCFPFTLVPSPNIVLTGIFNYSLWKIQYECDHSGYLYGATPDQYVGGKMPQFNVSVCSYGVGCFHSWTITCVIIDFVCQVGSSETRD